MHDSLVNVEAEESDKEADREDSSCRDLNKSQAEDSNPDDENLGEVNIETEADLVNVEERPYFDATMA